MKRKKRVGTKRRSTKTPITVKVSLIIIVFFVLFATVFKITELILTNKTDNFPKLEISLRDVSIEEIDAGIKDIKYPNNTATLTINGNPTTYKNVEIKGRGNTTWEKIKKPYQIKFENKENLFNLGNEKKWILLANFLDPTSLRNDIAFYLEKILDENFMLSGAFTELYIDNNYRGLYYLTEKVEISKSRINLDDPFDIIVELDNLYGKDPSCHYDNYQKNCFVIKGSVNADNEETSIEQFLHSFNSLGIAIKHKDWDEIQNLIDVDSFAKYYLLNEFAVNPDSYSTSLFMYTQNGKIHAGPGWDFDFALGNNIWSVEGIDQNVFLSPFETMALKNYLNKGIPHLDTVSTFFYDLLDVPEFETRVKEIYQETLSGHGEELLEYIKSQAEYIKPAAMRDQERWKLKTNFDEEVDYLIDWVAKRYDHFEQTYGATPIEPNSDPGLEFLPPEQE